MRELHARSGARTAMAGVLIGVLVGGPLAAQETVLQEVRDRVELLRRGDGLRVRGETLKLSAAVAEAYEAGGFSPLWTGPARRAFANQLEGLAADGLVPVHYHLDAIRRTSAAASSAAADAELDLLHTHALLLAVHDLRFGRANPAPPVSSVRAASIDEIAGMSAQAFRIAVESGRASDLLRTVRPDHFVYRGLAVALADLRRMEAAGGWQILPAGAAMRLDSTDARVPLLRRRLAAQGYDVKGATGDSLVFDEALDATVRAFQHGHALNDDGIVGPATLAELNVPVERRIDQVRVNLERARWLVPELPDTFIVVNIAGAQVYLMHGENVAFESRVIVGKPYTRTPVFRAELRFIDLDPSWTVPPGIVGEVLAAIRRSPGYLASQSMRVIDRGGRAVNPATIDFGGYTARTFPYVFRQDPGPLNPLGRVRFGLPNPYHVYLHDTPSKSLFAREDRLFSHGCIRVEDPLRLAALVLDDPAWSYEALVNRPSTDRTYTIPLRRPVPVLIQYWTASADLHHEIHFYRDVYGRDAAVLRELNRPH